MTTEDTQKDNTQKGRPFIYDIPSQMEEFNIIPLYPYWKKKVQVKEDGSKMITYLGKFYNPSVSGSRKWKPYQTNPFPRKLLEDYKGNVGVVLGKYEEGYKPSSSKAKKSLELLYGPDYEEDVVDYREYYLVQVDIDNPDHYQYFKDVPSFTVQSGRGYHIYLKSLEPIRTKADYPITGIEVRSTGGLCPIPPSIHPKTGKPYQTIKDVPILEVPNAYQYTTDLIPPELHPRTPQEFEYKDTTRRQPKFKHGTDRVLSQKIIDNLVFILKDYYTPGHRDNLIIGFTGWLRKTGIEEDNAVEVVRQLAEATEDEEVDNRIVVCRNTYEKEDLKTVLGVSGVKGELRAINPTGWLDSFMILELILEGRKPWHDTKKAKEILSRGS